MTKSSKKSLELLLRTKKAKLEHLHEQHTIATAVYNAKKELIIEDIDCIEKQLKSDK